MIAWSPPGIALYRMLINSLGVQTKVAGSCPSVTHASLPTTTASKLGSGLVLCSETIDAHVSSSKQISGLLC